MTSALQKIPSLLARHRRKSATAAALHVLWILMAVHLLALAVLGWFSLRFPLSPTCLILMSWTYAIYLLAPLAYWLRWTSGANAPEAVAQDLDRANPGAPDPFRTTLSLQNHGEETLAQLDRLYSGILPKLDLPRPRVFPSLQRAALAAGLLALAVSAALTGRPVEFLHRASLPWIALDRLPILRFDLGASPKVIGVGDSAKVSGRARNLLPGQAVFAYIRTAVGESRFPLAVDADQHFAFAFGPAETDFTLYFAGDNGRSPSLRFKVLPPPFLERIQAVLEPPGYTRLRPDTLPQGVVRFPVLPGTRVTWIVAADRGLKRLAWSFRSPDGAPGSDPVPVAGAAARDADSARAKVTDAVRPSEDTLGPGTSFRVVREVRKPLDYSYWLQDDQGIRSRPSLPSRVDIIPDLAPEVDLVSPGGDTVLDRDARMPLAFRVKDDFGVSSLKLIYRVLANGKVAAEGQRDGRDWLKQARAGLVETEWDLHALNLRPDNVVEFHLAAVDNDTVNGPKTGRSATRTLRMPTVQEVLASSRQKEQSAVANLKSALQRENQLERKLEREKQSPREEGPPMLADYEINRIMVDDPREHQRRVEAAMAQMSQSLDRQSKEEAGNDKSADKSSKAAKEMSQAQAAAKEMQEFLKKNEAVLPHGNQSMLPLDEREKNLEDLLKSQKEQAAKLAALREKLEKTPGKPQVEQAKSQLDYLAKDLDRNIQNQSDLEKMLQDQAAQAKAKSEMMDQAIQEQMKMAEDMKGANDDLKKSMDQEAKNGLLSPELMEKMKKVQDLLREVLPDSLQKLMESKLQGQEVNEQELKEKLKEMLERQAELAESLNRALAMLEQLKDRKRMQELKSMLEDLKAREEALAKQLQTGQAGAPQDAEQKALQQETQKSLADFAAQAAGRKDLQEVGKKLPAGPVQKDMQDVRQSVASASKSKSGKEQSAAAASAAKSAASAAAKLGEMGDMLGDAMAGMESSVDLAEAQDLLQESLNLSRLQLLIRSGSARRQAEGWEADEAALYGSVAQTAQWLNERVKALAAKVPFLGQALTTEARGLTADSREAARQYNWDIAEKSLRHNQNLSRELLKLLKMAQSSGQGSGSGSGSGSPGSSGQGGGGSGGDLSGQLQGMSGKQMAINQATYQLLKAMMEGRQPGKGKGGKQGQGGEKGGEGQQGDGGQGAQGGKDGKGGMGGQGGEGGADGEGSLGGMANKQGELGESLESLAEGMGEEGGSAQKIRSLAEEARRLEEELRGGRMTPEELKRRQERFQSKLLEASNAMQERGQSESRQAETSHGRPSEITGPAKPADEARMLQLLREARRSSKAMRLTEGQRKYLDEYYESLLTR